jgi:hypothetical protein
MKLRKAHSVVLDFIISKRETPEEELPFLSDVSTYIIPKLSCYKQNKTLSDLVLTRDAPFRRTAVLRGLPSDYIVAQLT